LFEIIPYTGATEFKLLKLLGKYPEENYFLTRKIFDEDLTNTWHHIDITRDEAGKLLFYLNSEIIFDLIDTSINDSEYFNIVSNKNGSLIDNIVVSDTVDISPPTPISLDTSIKISKEEVTTEEDVLITIQVKDDQGESITGVSVNLILEDKTIEASEESFGVYQVLLDTSDYLGNIEFVVTSEKTGFVSSESTHSFEVVSPASFEVSNLIIDPTSVKEGESISISVECRNVGGVSGSYDIVVRIDGATMDTSSVTLDAGESTTVSFIVSPSQSGTYSLEVNGLTGSYTVEKPSFLEQIPGFPFESLIVGIVSGIMILWFIQKNRSSYYSLS
jgi:hypothetical protein